jgi:hypothetical protein
MKIYLIQVLKLNGFLYDNADEIRYLAVNSYIDYTTREVKNARVFEDREKIEDELYEITLMNSFNFLVTKILEFELVEFKGNKSIRSEGGERRLELDL